MTTTSKSQPAKASAKVTDAPADSGASRAPTKIDQLLTMPQTPDGVSIEELSDRFGWVLVPSAYDGGGFSCGTMASSRWTYGMRSRRN